LALISTEEEIQIGREADELGMRYMTTHPSPGNRRENLASIIEPLDEASFKPEDHEGHLRRLSVSLCPNTTTWRQRSEVSSLLRKSPGREHGASTSTATPERSGSSPR
jgi:hypothetical protein